MSITYEIESGIDFFKELKQIRATKSSAQASASASASASAVSLSVEEPRCLITDEKLRKDNVTLNCGHRFNYIPLFKEVLFQKCSLLPKNLSSKIITTYTKPAITASAPTTLPTNQTNQPSNVTSVLYNSSYNLETTKLNYNEVKCPYCRAITPYILPYYPYPDVCKVKYVNFPSNLALPSVSCEYEKFMSGGTSEHDDNSCRALCMYNEKHNLILCNKHLNKLEAKSISSTKKKSSKQNKPTALIMNSNIDDENVIISHHNPATAKCSFILLSGPRKGLPCEKAIWVPKMGILSPTMPPTPTPTHTGACCKAHYGKVNSSQLG